MKKFQFTLRTLLLANVYFAIGLAASGAAFALKGTSHEVFGVAIVMVLVVFGAVLGAGVATAGGNELQFKRAITGAALATSVILLFALVGIILKSLVR